MLFHRLNVLQAVTLESCYAGHFKTLIHLSLAAETLTATLARREARPAAVTYNLHHLQPQPVKM